MPAKDSKDRHCPWNSDPRRRQSLRWVFSSSALPRHRAKCLTERVKRGKRDMEKANEELNTMLDEANALLKEVFASEAATRLQSS